MPSDRDPNAIRLPDDVAQRLLARATELDDRSGRTSIDQLRRAATEAGISPAAFEAALAELARGELGRPAGSAPLIDARGSWVTSSFRRGLIVAAAAVSLLVLAIGAVRSVTTAEEPVRAIEVEVAPVGDDYAAPTPPPDAMVAPDVGTERVTAPPAEVRTSPADVPPAAPPRAP